jgi:hypothetical protein
MGTRTKAFLCYSRRDLDWVRCLRDHLLGLVEHGVDAFWDQELARKDTWNSFLEREVDTADHCPIRTVGVAAPSTRVVRASPTSADASNGRSTSRVATPSHGPPSARSSRADRVLRSDSAPSRPRRHAPRAWPRSQQPRPFDAGRVHRCPIDDQESAPRLLVDVGPKSSRRSCVSLGSIIDVPRTSGRSRVRRRPALIPDSPALHWTHPNRSRILSRTPHPRPRRRTLLR